MLGSLLSSLMAGMVFSLFFQSIAAHPSSTNETCGCLTDDEAQHIASQFVQLFNTNSTGQSPTGTDIPMSLLTPDYIDFDGDALLCNGTKPCRVVGPDNLLFSSRAQLVTEYKGLSDGTTNSMYREFQARVVHAFASCDRIAVRYEGFAKANNGNLGVTAPDGTPFRWLGISLLKVDLRTRMVERGESSEDRLTQYSALGITDLTDLINPPH